MATVDQCCVNMLADPKIDQVHYHFIANKYDIIIIHDYSWLFMIIRDYSWLFMIIHDYSWLSMIIHDYSWLFTIIHDYSWLFMIIHDCQWWISGLQISPKKITKRPQKGPPWHSSWPSPPEWWYGIHDWAPFVSGRKWWYGKCIYNQSGFICFYMFSYGFICF